MSEPDQRGVTEVPPGALVTLSLDPADYALRLDQASVDEPPGAASGEVASRADGRVVLRFSMDACGWDAAGHPASDERAERSDGSHGSDAAPLGDLSFSILAPELTLADALFLLSVLWLTEQHQDTYLQRPHPWGFVETSSRRRFSLPHPPRIETAQALLGGVPVLTRVRLLSEACELALPVWAAWARSGKLSYFDGIMAMSSVPRDLAELTIAAVTTWMSSGDAAPLNQHIGEYHALHWPMLEREWEVPENVYYSLFAPCNLAECARGDGDLAAALVCIQQATAARATNALGQFLGEPFRKAFLLAWWHACVRILAAD